MCLLRQEEAYHCFGVIMRVNFESLNWSIIYIIPGTVCTVYTGAVVSYALCGAG